MILMSVIVGRNRSLVAKLCLANRNLRPRELCAWRPSQGGNLQSLYGGFPKCNGAMGLGCMMLFAILLIHDVLCLFVCLVASLFF